MEDNSNHGAHAPLLNESGGHHHRRISSVTPRRAIRRENTNEVAIASGSEDEVLASPASANDILEMDDINSDEETGLTAKERRRNTLQPRYHSHDDREGPLSSYEKRLADRDVLKQLIINAMLIGSWYLFATSISVVRSPPPYTHMHLLTRAPVQQMDVLTRPSQLPLPPLHDIPPHARPILSCIRHPIRLPKSPPSQPNILVHPLPLSPSLL